MNALQISPLDPNPPYYWFEGRRITFVERRLSNGKYLVWVERGPGMDSDMMIVSPQDVRALPPLSLFRLLRQLIMPFALDIAALEARVPAAPLREYRVYRVDTSAQMSLPIAA